MIYAVITVVLLYYLSFLRYFQRVFPPQKNQWIRVVLSLLVVDGTYTLLEILGLRWLFIPVVLVAMAAGFRFSTGMTRLQALYGGGLCVLSAYCFRSVITSVVAFALLESNPDFIVEPDTYFTMTVIAFPLALMFYIILRRTVFQATTFRRFLSNNGQLKMIVAYEITAAVYLTIVSRGRDFFPHITWYIGVTLGAGLLTLGVLAYLIYQSNQTIQLMEYKWRAQMLEEQYARQLRHYKSYEKYTEGFRAFQHDYKAMMISVKSLISERENDQAIELLDSIYDTMQKNAQVYKRYSDHAVLDAILQDYSVICEENEIRFSFQVFVPRKTAMTLLDAIRVFSNILNNGVEACCKIPVTERFIEITSQQEQGWAVLQAVNSYNGETHIENSKYVTTKPEKEAHGLGLEIVKEIAENLGGFVTIDAAPEKKTFMIRVLVPQANGGHTPASDAHK